MLRAAAVALLGAGAADAGSIRSGSGDFVSSPHPHSRERPAQPGLL